jgi:hypothetical protein
VEFQTDHRTANLQQLAELIRARNETDRLLAQLISRPATTGNIGEYVASVIFGIELVSSGSHAGYDGVFRGGAFAGKTVNVKTYSRHESILDVGAHPCDYYLVLAGPPGPAKALPWGIDSVFLLETEGLMQGLIRRGVKIGVATSVLKVDWEAARIFPPLPTSRLQLTSWQLEMLSLFSPSSLSML